MRTRAAGLDAYNPVYGVRAPRQVYGVWAPKSHCITEGDDTNMALTLIEHPDPTTQIIFETGHEEAMPTGAALFSVAPDDGGSDEVQGCAKCGHVLIRGPVAGRLDRAIVIQCPVCQSFNKATD